MKNLLEKLEQLMNRQESFKERIKEFEKNNYQNSSDEGLRECLSLFKEYRQIQLEIDFLMKEIEKLEACA